MILVRDGGILTFYALQNTAEPGMMPVKKLVSTGTAFFAFRTAGVTRRYEAKGANAEFNHLVRCFHMMELPEGTQYVILDGDESQYQIDIAEPMVDQDAIDLTLIRVGELYEVATE